MLPSEWSVIVEEVESLWGRSAKWQKADAAFRFARTVPASAARAAVESLFLAGEKNAPSPAEVLAQARSRIDSATTVEEARRYCSAEKHSYAIVDEQNGIRVGVCVRCRDEISVPASLLTTEAEREDGVAGRYVDDAEVTERITVTWRWLSDVPDNDPNDEWEPVTEELLDDVAYRLAQRLNRILDAEDAEFRRREQNRRAEWKRTSSLSPSFSVSSESASSLSTASSGTSTGRDGTRTDTSSERERAAIVVFAVVVLLALLAVATTSY